MVDRHARPALRRVRRVDERDAVAPVVGHDDDSLGSDDLREVVVEQRGVAPQVVAPAARLVGEPVAGEVDQAHAEAPAQPLGHLEPVDAACRKPVHEREDRCLGGPELHVEDLHRRRALVDRGPGEERAAGAPSVGAGRCRLAAKLMQRSTVYAARRSTK